MKLLVVADTHGNLEGWRRALELAGEGANLIVHCGDVLYHGPKFAPVEGWGPRGLAEAINTCPLPVLIARGNGDAEVDQLVLEVPLLSPYVFTQVDGLRLLVTHGHLQPEAETVALARKWEIDLLLTGHTHVPMVERHGKLVHVNPGTVTYPLASEPARQRCTCASWEDGTVTHFDVDTGEVLAL